LPLLAWVISMSQLGGSALISILRAIGESSTTSMGVGMDANITLGQISIQS